MHALLYFLRCTATPALEGESFDEVPERDARVFSHVYGKAKNGYAVLCLGSILRSPGGVLSMLQSNARVGECVLLFDHRRLWFSSPDLVTHSQH